MADNKQLVGEAARSFPVYAFATGAATVAVVTVTTVAVCNSYVSSSTCDERPTSSFHVATAAALKLPCFKCIDEQQHPSVAVVSCSSSSEFEYLDDEHGAYGAVGSCSSSSAIEYLQDELREYGAVDSSYSSSALDELE